jgi:hypothetical protein
MKKIENKQIFAIFTLLTIIFISGCCMEPMNYDGDGGRMQEELTLPESTPTPAPSTPTTCEIYGSGIHLNLSMNVQPFSTTGNSYQCTYTAVACDDHSFQFYVQLENDDGETYILSNSVNVKNGTSITQSTKNIKSFKEYNSCYLTINYPSGLQGYKCEWDFATSEQNCYPHP